MRITANGLIIGSTANAANKLDVEGAAVIGATYSGTNTAPTNGLLVEGDVAIGATSAAARVHVAGAGTTSATDAMVVENSAGTDILRIRNDGVSAFGGSPATDVRLTAAATTADSTTFAFDAKRSSTSLIKARADGRVSINNAAFQDALTINGWVRTDGVVFTSTVSSQTSSGKVQYNNGSGGTYSGYLTVGDGTRQLALMPTMIERDVIDYNVDWTVGRGRSFWTVPARFDGWKIAKVYIGVTSIGAGAGDDELSIEIGGVVEGVQIITAGSHTLVMDDVINTDDVITFYVTEISATPAKGLNVALELSKN